MKATLLSFVIVALACVAASPVESGYSIGDRVSDFRLKNVDGKMISLTDYKESKGVILIFDCNTCPYSQAYNDRIIALNDTYAGKGYPVVTVNSNDGEESPGDSFEAMVERARAKDYSFPYLLDETQEIARAFGATNTPHVFVLQRKGDSFIVSYIGAIDNNPRNGAQADKKYVAEAVDALLSGNPVKIKTTKAVGCGIRWKDA